MKYAVVTGSTKGIGKQIAIDLLKNDYFVFLNYANDETYAKQFEEEYKSYSDKFICIKKDLSDYDNAIEFCKIIKSKTSHIDVLILNCGVTEKTEFGSITNDSWQKAMNINLNVPFFIIQELSPVIRNENGRIILMGSVMGKYPHSTSLVYNVSKAAVNSLCNALVKYFAERKITVNSICPGFIMTPYHNNRSEESFEKINSKIALHRFGTAEEISSLCMEIIKNQYINGSNIDINGGYDYY